MSKLFDKLRMSQWLILAAILGFAVFVIAPEQLTVGVWKLLLITSAAYVGYWLDRLLFPYARPHEALEEGSLELACCAMRRRAIVMAAVIIAVAVGV